MTSRGDGRRGGDEDPGPRADGDGGSGESGAHERRERMRDKPRQTGRVVLLAGLVAVATAIGTGVGAKVIDLFSSEPELVTAAARDVIGECGTPLFVQGAEAEAIAATNVDRGAGWEAFAARHRGVPADRSAVEVSIQGESDRTVTLTAIDFDVVRRGRPDGAVFSNPCGDDFYGYGLNVDLDEQPPQIIKSNGDPNGSLLVHAPRGRKPDKPLRFPWTVSATDPLLLTVVAETTSCLCTWSATITWRSGERSGLIELDNGGRGYPVAGSDGLRRFASTGPNSTWRALPAGGQ